MRSNFLFSGLSNFFKVVSGVLLFFVLARVFSVEMFGELVYAISVSIFVLMIVDYGYLLYIPREATDDKIKTNELIASAITIKLLLAAAALALLYLSHFWGIVSGQLSILFTLSGSVICMSFASLFLLPFRSINQFHVESGHLFIYNMLLSIFCFSLAIFTKDLFFVSLGFLFSRVIFLILAYASYTKLFKFRLRLKWAYLRDIKKVTPFVVYTFTATILLQIDTLILNYYHGYYSVGLYQAGLRFLVAAAFLQSIFYEVLLPKYSQFYKHSEQGFTQIAIKFNRLIWLLGFAGLAFMLLFDKWLVLIAYGAQMSELIQYMPFFSLIIFLRFANVGYSLILISIGGQKMRNYVVLLTLAVVMYLQLTYVPEHGLIAVLYSVIVGNVVLNLGCMAAVFRQFGTLFVFNRRRVQMTK